MRASQVTPYGNYVLIKVEERKTQIGSIHLPGNETGVEIVGNKTARVIAVGPGRREKRELGNTVRDGVSFEGILRRMIPVGSRIAFRGYVKDCQPLDVEDEGEYAFLHAGDILGIIDEDLSVGEWGHLEKGSL